MRKTDANRKNFIGLGVMAAAAVVVVAVSGPVQKALSAIIPAPAGVIVYKQVDAPVPARANGVISADEWKSIYPEIVASYRANDDNHYRVAYTEENPYIVSLYEGFGFAKDYTSAVSHTYTLEDVAETERPHPLANCLTCKTPDYTKLVNDMGVEAYKYDFNETHAQMAENISCYNCHENQAGNGGQLVVTHSYVKNALGSEMDSIDPSTLSCGQCHIEYYFAPETKETMMPYTSVASMDPEAILAYYDEMGFSDWTQESTGTAMLKAQHPEFETYLGAGSAHVGFGMSCADCHMAVVTEKGTTYTSHKWESPLANQAILDTCVQCHGETDMAEKVKAIQTEITGRENAIGQKLAELKDALAAEVAAGEMSEDQLNEIRSLYRSAQWYWDFCYVENSEGAHNSALAGRCLDKCEELMAEAMELLGL